MPLGYLIYRCPACGRDPTVWKKDRVSCPSCKIVFTRGREGGVIRVEEPSGRAWDVPACHITRVLDRGMRDEAAALEGEGNAAPLYRSRVALRRSGKETPVRWGGELLGFAEAMGEGVPGTVALSRGSLTFVPEPRVPSSRVPQDGPDPRGTPAPPAGPEEETWPLLEIRAIQTSSSSLQFSPVGGGLVEFRFPSDSPYRWESLLRHAVRRAYREAGLGEIVEFQPRIVTEHPRTEHSQTEHPRTEHSQTEHSQEEGPGGERRGEG